MAKQLTNTLIKWVVIASISLTVLISILLLLGYLLAENEKNVKALKAEIERTEQRSAQQTTSVEVERALLQQPPISRTEVKKHINQQVLLASSKVSMLDDIKQAIINNLVCTDVSQCHLIDTASVDLGCVVAVNSIGKSQLSKFDFSIRDNACEEQVENLSLTCHHNICSIK